MYILYLAYYSLSARMEYIRTMARKRKKKRKPFFDDLAPQTKQAIGAVFFGVLGIFFFLSWQGSAGVAGDLTHKILTFLFGGGFVLAPIACLLYVYVLLRPREDERVSISKIIGVTLLILAALGVLTLYREAGGIGGMILEKPLTALFGTVTTGIVLFATILISFFLTFNIGLSLPTFSWKKDRVEEEDYEEEYEDDEEVEKDEDYEEKVEETPKKSLKERVGLGNGSKQEFAVSNFNGPYDPPPLSLLQKDKGKAQVGDVKANANIIKRTLQNFKIQVEMDEVSIGPSVTRYSLKPAEGVRISKIVGLQNNLELALAASPIRIEAPIPGRSLVGIEVPNTTKSMVGLASLLASPEYTDSPKPLLVGLGKDISGNAHFADLAKMPHTLIAGTTGSGKSVTIHTLVASLLFRNSPEQLRFIMVDPKRVELTLYNSIPHLLTPVITDAKKCILSLKWAAKEMERRYDILQEYQVRDIHSYHENVYKPSRDDAEEEEGEENTEPLPYIVIIIDELADIMQTYPRELEASIIRLAQMSRAVGIHLVLSTQRPSVNVITGLIKANVPARIALQVASQVDSRTILDQVGAEKLLGAGDMLFLSGELAKPQRLQSAFIGEEELKKITKYLKNQSDAQTLDSINFDDSQKENNSNAFFQSVADDEEDDDLYEEARDTVIDAGKASTSYLQRRLRIGYSRAARLMDILEERGVIGPADGAKPREILASSSEKEYENEESEDDDYDEYEEYEENDK